MSSLRLIVRSATYHWRTNMAVTLGVAAAVAVLAGALLVGDSVRASLRDIAVGRLGRTDVVVSSTGFFREAAAEALRAKAPGTSAAPLVVASGFVTHEASGRRAASVLVYGVDERFWQFHGLVAPDGVQLSPALAAELGGRAGDVVLVRLQKPSEIPLESLFGRRDDVGRTVRLTIGGTLERERLGEFALRPQQSEVRAVFAPLRRIQRDLAVPGQVNTILVSSGAESEINRAVPSALTLEDLGVTVGSAPVPVAITISSPTGIVSEPLEAAVLRVAAERNLEPKPVFTYLANAIRKGDRQIPYSLIAAVDLALLPGSGKSAMRGAVSTTPDLTASAKATASPPKLQRRRKVGPTGDPIILNEWAARELAAVPGDRIEVDYYLWDSAAGLTTRTAAFALERIVPIEGFAADRRLAPEYPGITAAASLADWDPPFPIDLSRVRPIDEEYWKAYRTTPKAFIDYARGRALWKTRYGAATSIRLLLPPSAGGDGAEAERRVSEALGGAVSPASLGTTVVPVRRLALAASSGSTDFGEYFIYFSFFLVVSALLLAVLFFRLGIEQRLRQIGIMRAAGFTSAHVRRLLLAEALAISVVGSLIGAAGAIAYGRLIIFGLKTWWVGAVGTTLLALHVSGGSLAAGAAMGVIAAAASVALSLRAVARLSPRALLTAQSLDAGTGSGAASRRPRIAAVVFGVAGLAMLVAGFVDGALQTGMFFGAGSALLVACLCWMTSSLRARDARPLTGRGLLPIVRLGVRGAAFRPGRSVLSAALIASAAFVIVSVGAFSRGGGDVVSDPHSGTGGFALIAESELPLLASPNDAKGREALIVQAPEFSRVAFTRFRLRPGDDTSCLNLYRPSNPAIIAPENGFIERGRFAFSASLSGTAAERENPWTLLRRREPDGAVPVVADATSLQYVLHASLGDTLSIDIGTEQPLTLRFVAALSDSVLQGQLVMSEENFVRLFPALQGYRFFLIDAPDVRTLAEVERMAGVLERELGAFGFDAVSTPERLAAFHRVENTYISTFQALGGLGLLLGTFGLAAIMFRNVLERRRELALLGAVGYNSRHIAVMIMAEAALLVGAGLAVGTGCALLAIGPAWLGHAHAGPGWGLAALLALVCAAGLTSAWLATRAALRGNLLAALRAE
jgi:putative ABC transport system permease protein